MARSYSLQRRLFWRLGALFLAATAVVTVGLFARGAARIDPLVANVDGAEAEAARDALVHILLFEYFGDVLVLIVPFIAIVLLVGYVTLAGAFRDVSALSAQAAAIEPPASGVRLPTEAIPQEIKPLIVAMNEALNRLEHGFATQRQFTANAAHQLRTPLAALGARIDAIGSHEDRESGEAIQRDVRRLNRLVNQLLKITRFTTHPLEMEPVDLREIAAETVSFLAPLVIRRGRTLSLIGTSAAVPVQGNAGAIGDALANLIENAMEHTPAGTDVEVEVQDTGELRVLDRGPGIPEESRQQVFERFWRGSNSRYEGSGLGLSIVAEVAQQHGASVSLDARAGGGTAASIKFRRAT